MKDEQIESLVRMAQRIARDMGMSFADALESIRIVGNWHQAGVDCWKETPERDVIRSGMPRSGKSVTFRSAVPDCPFFLGTGKCATGCRGPEGPACWEPAESGDRDRTGFEPGELDILKETIRKCSLEGGASHIVFGVADYCPVCPDGGGQTHEHTTNDVIRALPE